jgi:hypothetical protein
MGHQAKRVARVVLRCHPAPWRARYEAEVAALLDDLDVSVRDVLDLAGSAAREWKHAAWTAMFGDRSPLRELAWLLAQAVLGYWLLIRLFEGDEPNIGAAAWTALNLSRVAWLTLRAYLVVSVGAALLDAVNRRAGRVAERWWFQGAGRIVLLFLAIALDDLGSRKLHLWSSAADLAAVYGGFASMILVSAFIQFTNRGRSTWLDVWRGLKKSTARPPDPRSGQTS